MILQNGGRRISLAAGLATMPRKGGINQASDDKFGDCDVWMFGLLTFAGPDNTLLSFEALLNRPHKIGTVRRESKEGTELIYVSLEHELSCLEFWFDPQVDFLVRKHVVIAKLQSIRSELEVMRFKEAAPGVFFPERVETRNSYGSQPLPSQTVDFLDIRVNRPIPANVFQFRFPSGTEVTDYILGKIYKVDENGGLSGSMRDLIRFPSAARTDVAPRSETREEPKLLSRWILPVSVAILALAGVLGLVRRWKQKHSSIPASSK